MAAHSPVIASPPLQMPDSTGEIECIPASGLKRKCRWLSVEGFKKWQNLFHLSVVWHSGDYRNGKKFRSLARRFFMHPEGGNPRRFRK